MPRMPVNQIRKLKEARKLATLEPMSLGFPNETVIDPRNPERGPIQVTDFCREQTHLYRETWLIPLLDQVIAWAED